MNQPKSALISVLKLLLLSTAITPLIFSNDTIFPFVFGKMIFFRSVVEIALILFLVYLLTRIFTDKKLITADNHQHKSAVISINQRLISVIKNPLFILIILFFISLIISTVFAVNPYRAFWGDAERAEGLFGMLHCLAFLIMVVFVFEKKDWLNFFKISLFTGLILIFYGLLQYFGVKNFSFSLSISPRPGSYIGNSAFLATYMFFIIAFATIVWYQSKAAFWKYFSLLMIVLAAAMIFITGTRGAILGLGAGIFALLVYFSIFGSRTSEIQSREIQPPKINGNIRRLNFRILSVSLLILIIIFSITFISTRNSEIWQKIPGISRLAQTATFDLNDRSTQMRLMNWRISWEAFKEKPIFGWGPENFLYAYQKNYNPDMAIYGETWLDRAHNKIIDLAVMQGIFGLLTYLLMFGGIFYILFQRKSTLIYADDKLIYTDKKSPFLMAILIAYFIQNLVLFDQITSYIPFFAILGFLISKTLIYAGEKSESISQNQHQSVEISINQRFSVYKLSIIILLSSMIFSIGFVLYFYNYVPYVQTKAFKESTGLGRVDLVVDKLKKAMYPYNFAQYNIRGQGIDSYYLNQYFYKSEYIENSKLSSLADLLIEGQDEIVRKEPYDVRTFIREVEMLNPIAETNPELYKKTESLLRQALEIAPQRQELYYHLAFALAGQGRHEESIKETRYALNLSPNVARAHYHLGLMLVLAGNNDEEAKREFAIAEEIDPSFDSFLPSDFNNVILVYGNWGEIDKMAELVMRTLNGEIGRKFERKYYEAALNYYAILHNAENFIKVASYLSNFDDIKDDMEVLIDLAKKENWEIIDNL